MSRPSTGRRPGAAAPARRRPPGRRGPVPSGSPPPARRFAARAAAVRRRPWLLAAWGLAVVAVLGAGLLAGRDQPGARGPHGPGRGRPGRAPPPTSGAAPTSRSARPWPGWTPTPSPGRVIDSRDARRGVGGPLLAPHRRHRAPASGSRSWPSRTLKVKYRLRTRTGVVYATVSTAPRGVPVITAPPAHPEPGRPAWPPSRCWTPCPGRSGTTVTDITREHGQPGDPQAGRGDGGLGRRLRTSTEGRGHDRPAGPEGRPDSSTSAPRGLPITR